MRKRKRRRRSKSGQAQPSATAGVSADAAGAKPVAAPGADNSSRKRSKKSRQRRSLQGRPLATSEKPRPAGDAARQQAPQSAAANSRAEERPSSGFSGSGNHGHERRSSGQAFSYGSDSGSPLYAALDLGTNNCRLLIAQPTRPGQFRVVDAFSRIVRLGEGLGASGRLSQDAMDRSIEALKVCAAKLKTRYP
ncbi:hypothetical protein LP421_14810 [Rhizobium sp. RCAM05350]|nr:hypothetical protein LP421_14810 [Rhizobium sp. RCAM05350]